MPNSVMHNLPLSEKQKFFDGLVEAYYKIYCEGYDQAKMGRAKASKDQFREMTRKSVLTSFGWKIEK